MLSYFWVQDFILPEMIQNIALLLSVSMNQSILQFFLELEQKKADKF